MEFRIVLTLTCVAGLGPLLDGASRQSAADILGQTVQSYTASSMVRVKPAFVPLPPGAVLPQGWLKDWSLDAANGITGHLDEYSTTYGEAWKGRPLDAMRANPDGTGWPLEQSSYWLDGAVRLAYILGDKALIAKVSRRLDTVVDGVLNGGESFVFWRPSSVLNDTFNNWAHSHMGRALVAYYEATGDDRILKALVKTYQNYPLPDFRAEFAPVSGTVNIDPMLETYILSGDRAVLDKVMNFAKTDNYTRIRQAWVGGDIQPGHNVIFYENIRVPALLYPWTGEKEDLDATLKTIAWHDERFMQPYGISSGEEYHAGIGATRNTETCNVAASMWTYLWMLRITGEGSYADRIERVFFNAGPAPVSRDFKIMCYYQSPNRYSSALPSEEPRAPGGGGSYKFTNIGHRVLCCVGNLNRVIPSYVMHMWMATLDRGVAATLYGPSQLRSIVGDHVNLEIDEQTSYPFAEGIDLTIKPEKQVEFPLYLHIPSWCANPEIKVNGNAVPIQKDKADFVKMGRLWKDGDKVSLRFPMSANVVRGRETPYPRIPYFEKGRSIARETGIDTPYASVYYGPLLFSLPIPDENPNKETASTKYNYALDITPGLTKSKAISVVHRPMPAKWTWSIDAPVELKVDAREFNWQPTELQPLPKDVVAGGTPAKVVLVPYGCTKFRVSMFPVTAKTWGAEK